MKYKQITRILFELSKYCILNCKNCDRSRNQQTYLDTEIIINLLKTNPLDYILLSGCHGEPTSHPDFLKICKIAKEQNIRIDIETNGQFHNDSWWKELGQILKKEDQIFWALDGINEQDYLKYRIKGNYNKVFQSFYAVKDNSDVTNVWKFILFPYNLSLQKEAEELAYKKGFDKFFPAVEWDNEKRTKSFLMEKDYTRSVSCNAIKIEEIYVDAFGVVYPCMDSRVSILRSLDILGPDLITKEDHNKIANFKLKTGKEKEVLHILNFFYSFFFKNMEECKNKTCNAICGNINSTFHKLLHKKLEQMALENKKVSLLDREIDFYGF